MAGSTILRAVTWPLRPLWRAFLAWAADGDPWQRLSLQPSIARYGLGSARDFSWYLEGKSGVAVESLADVQAWLAGCEYVSDASLFRREDYWQHPAEFEALRKGDCEDHAIWAWRKLLELGIDAELAFGRLLPWDPADPNARGHVWVVVRRVEGAVVFETVEKRREAMLTPLADATSRYRPEYGVDGARKRFTYNGALITLRERS